MNKNSQTPEQEKNSREAFESQTYVFDKTTNQLREKRDSNQAEAPA